MKMSNRITKSIGLYPRKCKQCGKKFDCRKEYRYKILRYGSEECYDWFCSWKCIQAYRREHTKVKKPDERDQKILNLLDCGRSLAETGEMMGLSRKVVIRVRDKWRAYE